MAENRNNTNAEQTPENCTHNCDTCGAACASRTAPNSFLAEPNPNSNIKKIIGVVSGKGGVGKSLVTSLLATAAAATKRTAGVLDADLTGPSIPQLFGVHEKAGATETSIFPVLSETGVRLMSVNLILEDESEPVIWRGPVISGVVKQFYSEVEWGDIDVLFVDMPPGTGDVPLTVFQSIPLDGIVVVTSPQDLVSMIVTKAVRMAQKMNIPVLGVVENMSYITCPDCGKKIQVFGESGTHRIAEENGIANILTLPMDPLLAARCDAGRIEDADGAILADTKTFLEAILAE